MTPLRSAGKSLCTPRGLPKSGSRLSDPMVIDIDVACNARPPPLPLAGPAPPLGAAPPAAAARPPLAISGNLSTLSGGASSACGNVGITGASGNSTVGGGASLGASASSASIGAASASQTTTPRKGSTCASAGSFTPPRPASPASPKSIITSQGLQSGAGSPASVEILELRAENLRLRREVEQLKERLLGVAAGASAGKRVVGGGFRGSAIRSSDRKGGEVTSAEVEALRQVVHQKNDKIAQMELAIRGMQAEGGAQERTLCALQQSLTDAAHRITATAAERQVLQRSVEDLSTQLNGERQRIEEVQRNAAHAAASNEELLSRLENLRTQLEAQQEARSGAEEKAAKLEAELAGMSMRAETLEKTLETEQAEARERFACCSTRQRELSVQFLVAAGLRAAVLQLSWQAWLGYISEKRLGDQVESLRRQKDDEAERRALRSAQGREAQMRAESLHCEVGRLRDTVVEAQHSEDEARGQVAELLGQLECRAAELQAGAAERDRHTAKVRSELADAEAVAIALRTKVASLREEGVQAEARQREHQRREAELLAQAKTGREGSAAMQAQLEALRRELEDAKKRHADSEGSARKRVEELERRMKDAQAATATATAARDAAASRESALKTRVAELERRAKELEAAAVSGQAAADQTAAPDEEQASEREKRIQREETLLRQIRRLEQERDEARAQLQQKDARVPRPPAGASPKMLANSPRAASPGTKRRAQSSTSGSPTWLSAANVTANAGGTATASTTPGDAAASSEAAAAAIAKVAQLEQDLTTERGAKSQLQRELEELRQQQGQRAADPDPARLESQLQEARKAADGIKNELAEARADLSLERGELRKLRQVRDAHEEALAQVKVQSVSLEKSQAEVQKWREAALEATAQVRNSFRILVTAPKVSINIGKTEHNMQTGALPRDLETIRGIVREKVLPGFQQILAVAEEQGEQDVRQAVQGMVEGLATSVQQAVYRVLPEAEGTTSWDGFGSRLATLK